MNNNLLEKLKEEQKALLMTYTKQERRLAKTATHNAMRTYINKYRVNMWENYDSILLEMCMYAQEALEEGMKPIHVPAYAHREHFR